ncbi:OmpA family protein, partial [Thioclava sp. BHET1]
MAAALLALTGCMGDQSYVSNLDDNTDAFGSSTTHNELVATGQLNYAIDLARRFRQEVPTTVNFAFDQSTLDANARAILRKQAAFIRHFPEVRFRVFGYTDLVGSEAYNKGLG